MPMEFTEFIFSSLEAFSFIAWCSGQCDTRFQCPQLVKLATILQNSKCSLNWQLKYGPLSPLARMCMSPNDELEVGWVCYNLLSALATLDSVSLVILVPQGGFCKFSNFSTPGAG